MSIKAINDTAGPNGLVPTLLVFGAFPRLSDPSTTSSNRQNVQARGAAINKAMKELRKYQAQRQVRDAVAMRNGPYTEDVLNLPLQSDVLVWREKDRWTGPYKLLAISGETCTIELPNGPTNFRSTIVKPFYTEQSRENIPDPAADVQTAHNIPYPPDIQEDVTTVVVQPPPINNEINTHADQDSPPTITRFGPIRRLGCRPKGSRNKPKENTVPVQSFTSSKEILDRKLSIQLRKDGRITTTGLPFEQSDKDEIDSLITDNVFRLEKYDVRKHGTKLFNSRLVREIKNKTTQPYEKSRLVVQGYNDEGKETVLTQAPTIQRASQRLLLALAPALDNKTTVYLRDITQAYLQSTTTLNRKIVARLPKELSGHYSKDTIMVVVKPLYGIAEAGTHWWSTYTTHHKEVLKMEQSTFDPCLLISRPDAEGFGIVGMQTDDTLMLADSKFAQHEDKSMKFKSKARQALDIDKPITFNGCTLAMKNDNGLKITVTPKGQTANLSQVDNKKDIERQYVEQRARAAYIASIC